MNLASILPKGYTASTYAPADTSVSREFKPLPAALYTAEITSADVRLLKSGKGTGLTIEFTITEPAPHIGRKVWQNLNIQHSSEKAQEIALRELTNLFHAIGVETATEHELFGKILRIRTKIVQSDGYPDKAEVAGYESASTKPSPPAPRTAPPAGMKPPASWPQQKSGTGFENMDDDIPF